MALLALATTLVIRDRRKGNSTRLWEYACLFMFGIVGAAYGAANDAITVRVSSDYFTLGKGLSAGALLTANATRLGAQAGFSATVIACAVWLFALRHTPAPNRCRIIAVNAWLPVVTAVGFSIAGPLLLGRIDPLQFSQRLEGIISPSRITSFIAVWWAHMGAYFGLCAGVTGAIIRTRRQINTGQNKIFQRAQ